MVVIKPQEGDTVVRRDVPDVEMKVERVEVIAADGEHTLVTCVWPIFDNGDQPLYRRTFLARDLLVVRGERRGETLDVGEPATIESHRPMKASDMLYVSTSRELPERAISGEVLDAMERDGWTPRQVRDLIADYRACTREKGQP